MSRRNRRGSEPQPRASAPSSRRREEHDGRPWIVASVAGGAATKSYRCPGCQQEIVAGTPHLVVWPDDVPDGVGERRHWHTPCWAARGRRR